MIAFADVVDVAPADYGRSGHCGDRARHDLCAHRPGGPQEGGVFTPRHVVDDDGVVLGALVEPFDPSRVWRCSCECHTAPEQLGMLF